MKLFEDTRHSGRAIAASALGVTNRRRFGLGRIGGPARVLGEATLLGVEPGPNGPRSRSYCPDGLVASLNPQDIEVRRARRLDQVAVPLFSLGQRPSGIPADDPPASDAPKPGNLSEVKEAMREKVLLGGESRVSRLISPVDDTGQSVHPGRHDARLHGRSAEWTGRGQACALGRKGIGFGPARPRLYGREGPVGRQDSRWGSPFGIILERARNGYPCSPRGPYEQKGHDFYGLRDF